MISGISTFTNLPTPVKIGLLVLSGGGMIAVIGYLLPPGLLWIVLIGLAVVALLLLLYWRLLKWQKKRKAAPMERGVIENTSATPQGISEAAQMARLDDLRKKFEEGVEKFHAAGKSLYNFPWYMIVGEPGSGKTEAIRHCNVGFPPGLQDEFQGAGGTLNMNWWFTDHAVILDTAGRLMFEEVDTGGSGEWKEFLNLLKKNRSRCPVNGVLLVIPADSLIKDTADEIERKASKIARQFDLIQRTLDVRFPVFVVVTKSDLINGFRDFFDNLDDPQLQHQILGWSNPAPLDEPYNPDFVDQHLKTIRGRLVRRRLALIQEVISEEPGGEKIRTNDTLYAFPQSLTKITPRMARYLELIFSVGSQWSCKPLFFRGIYFTSSMREGSALDEDLAESLGVPVDSLPDGRVWERDRAYFLRDLFVKKVFREQGLVTYATNAKKLHSRRKATVLISAAASVILLLFFTFYAANRFSKSIGNMGEYLQKSASLIDQPDKLEVIKREDEDNYIYIGNAGIRGMPEDIKRFNFSARLADTVGQWEKKGVPWIFAPAAKFAKGIKPDKLNKAQAVLYEASVLQPFLKAARDMMDTQENGIWTRENLETSALRQLVWIEANKPLKGEGEYSIQTFLDPLSKYVLKHDPNQIQNYTSNRNELHKPLGSIYTYGDMSDDENKLPWPPLPLKTDPNIPDPAIEHGVKLFNMYWTDPNRSGALSQDNAQVETIIRLKDALDRFDAAEKRMLSLGKGFDPQSSKSYTVTQWENFVINWNENFENLKKSKESIDFYAGSLKSTQPLETLWTKVTDIALQDVNENYDFLLNELEDVNEVEDLFLSGIRDTLKTARNEMRNRLRNSEFEQKLKLLNEGYYARIRDGRHLYVIRFDMYAKADEQLRMDNPITSINDVAKAIPEVEKAAKDARNEIGELRDLDSNAFRFKQAADFSMLFLDLIKQRQLYNIVKAGLEVAPESIEKLRGLVGKEAYDPTTATTILGGWKFLGDTLKKYDLPDETRLSKMYEDANGFYTGYTRKYLDYWLESIPEDLIERTIPRENNWKAQHERLQKLDVLDVFAELSKFGKSIEKEVLDKLGNFISDDDGKVKQFRDNMENLSNRFFQGKCERVLENWGELSDDAFKARNMLLRDKPISFERNYFFSASSPVEFVDMYWTELTQVSLRILADEIQHEGVKAFNELRTQYGSKFPLARDSTEDLIPAGLREARSLLVRALSLETYDPGTIGAGQKTEIDKVNIQLERLREPPVPKSLETWVEAIKQVLQGLPEGKDPYYCKIILLSQDEQKRLLRKAEKLMVDDFRQFRIVQGSHASRRVETLSRQNLSVDIMIEYPGSSVRIDFYLYPSDPDTEPCASIEFPEPWACLRMLHQHYFEGREGYIRLDVKDKEGKGGTLYLQLKFCRESDGECDLSLPKPDNWPSLKNE